MQNQEKVPNYSVANVTKDAFTVTTYRSTDDSVVDTITIKKSKNGWETVDGKDYWYEDGVKQGTEGRGKEIYDPESDAWYWLDSDANGAKAVSKDVYQESDGGKWVRYDENGKMVKGWNTNENGTYYFDPITGAIIARGVYETYKDRNLRYSQVVPFTMTDEKNSGTNLPAQIDIYGGKPGMEYEFLFITKGGGSANKTFLYQQTKALLNEESLTKFIQQHIFDLGTSACPPYHLAICIGGTSAEMCLSTVKKASAGYLDELPTSGNEGGRCFRDLEWEEKVLKICRESGVGAQFGGKYLVHDVRVIRAPRHAASCPVAIGVSCSADRNIKAKITPEGIFLEELEKNPARFLPAEAPSMSPAVDIDLDEGMDKVRAILTKYPIKTRLNLRGTLIVARDIAHARIKQMLDEGKPMPEYFKKHPVYYAGPAKTPQGMASGSFGPTTAGRMDPYVDLFQSQGGSLVMVAKGNRSQQVTDACRKHGGFYLGSIGGPAAILAKNSIKSVEVVDFPELGMEAVRKIYVENFPAFIIVDDKGNDFFADFKH